MIEVQYTPLCTILINFDEIANQHQIDPEVLVQTLAESFNWPIKYYPHKPIIHRTVIRAIYSAEKVNSRLNEILQ